MRRTTGHAHARCCFSTCCPLARQTALSSRAEQRNPGVPLDLSWLDGLRVNQSAVEPASQHARHAPRGQEGRAGGLAAQGHHLHRPDHAQWRRHRRPRRTPVRQGTPSDSRRPARTRSACRRSSITTGAVCVYHRFVGHGGRGACRQRHPGRGRLDRLSRRPDSASAEAEGDRSVGERRRGGDRYRHHARTRADRQLASALRRGARLPRRLRPGAYESHSRHRRHPHALERRQGVDGLHDGRRRFHQDLDRQGRRQRDARRLARDGAHDPRLS